MKAQSRQKYSSASFPTIKATKYTNFSNLFLEGNSTCFGEFLCPSSGVSHCTHSNGMSFWYADSLGAGSGWNILTLLCVQWKNPDDGKMNCPKHVEFHSKNKFEKLVHLVGFYYKTFITMHGHMNVKFHLFLVQQWVTTFNINIVLIL